MMETAHSAPKLPMEREPAQGFCAVVVAHCCGISILSTLEALLKEVSRIIVVDNVSTDETPMVLARFAAEHPGRATILDHPVNNLAMAQNVGLRQAMAEGFPWVLLMDDDSVPEQGMVRTMIAALNTQPQPETVGILAPNIKDRHSRRETRYLRKGPAILYRRTGFGSRETMDDVLSVIASGSLIRTSLLEQIGLMDESFGIDDVDREFALRAVKAGYRILAVRDAVLNHQLGRATNHSVMGVNITTTNHRAERRYYIYRNRVRNWQKHGAAIPAFVLFDLLAVALDLMRVVLLEQGKMAKLRAAWHGLRDGLRGKVGMNPAFEPGEPLLSKPVQGII